MFNYSIKNTSLEVSAIGLSINHSITGLADGSVITIAYQNDNATLFVGAQGEVSRGMTQDRSAIVTLVLKHESESNKILSRIYNVDKKSAAGVFTLNFVDSNPTGNGDYKAIATSCFIKKHPDIVVSQGENITETKRTWEIMAGNLESFYI